MENKNITIGRLDYVNVVKAKCPDFKLRIDQGLPLPCLPYTLVIKKADPVSKKTVTTTLYKYDPPLTTTSYQTLWLDDSATMYKTVNGLLNDKYTAFCIHKDNKLLSKIQAQSLPIIMMYRERKETAKLITKFADHLVYFSKNWKNPKKILKQLRWDYSSVSSKRLRTLKKRVMASDTLGNAWLQYRFAWTPLLHDIIDSLKAAETSEKKAHTFKQRAGDKFSFDVTENYSSLLTETGYVFSGTREGWYGISVEYAISDTTLSALGSVTNLPATVWDSVPYSFVIDWIVDVSSYLDLYDATIGTAFTTGCRSEFYRQTITSPSFYRVYSPSIASYHLGVTPRSQSFVYDGQVRDDVRFTRTVLTTFPSPRLEYPLNASLKHVADTIALVGQRFLKRLR